MAGGAEGDDAESRQRDELAQPGDANLPRHAVRAVIAIAALATLAMAVAVLLGADRGDALVGGSLSLAALLLGVLAFTPFEVVQTHLSRIRSLTIGGIGIELSDYANLAAKDVSDGEETADKVSARGEDTFEALLDLRVGLEMKLAYIAKHILAPSPHPEALVPTFVTIGSLDFDRYLTRDQTRVAYDILSMRPFEFRALSAQESGLFLDGAWKFVDTIRVNVFAAQVRKALGDADWHVLAPYSDTRERRRDLLVQPANGDSAIQHHVIPVFALSKDSSLLKSPAERLRASTFAKGGGGRFVVVPPLSRSLDAPVPDGVRIVTLPGLLAELARERPMP